MTSTKPYPQPPPSRDKSWRVLLWCDGFSSFTALVSDQRNFCTGYFYALRDLVPAPPRNYWTLLVAPDGTVKHEIPPSPAPRKAPQQGDPIAWLHMDQVTVRLKLGENYREATTPASVYGVADALAQAANQCLMAEMAANPRDIGEGLKKLYELSKGAFDGVDVQAYCDELRGRDP